MISLHYTSHTKAYNTIYAACNIVEAIYSFTMGKAMDFKFCRRIKKSPLKISGKVAVGVVRDSGKFSWNPYIGRIARSSLR